MAQIRKAGQRAQVRDIGICNLQILKVRAAGKRRSVGDVAHGQDRDLELRHLCHKADVAQRGVVAQVQVLDIVAVVEALDVVVVEHAAAGGHGGQDALGIGAGGVVVAEEDAEDHLGVGVIEVDLLQALGLQTAGVHVHVGQLGHVAHDLVNESAVVRHGHAEEIDGGIGQVAVHAVELEGVLEHRLGQDLAQAGDVAPGKSVALRAEVYALEPRQHGQLVGRGLRLGGRGAAEIDALGVGIEHGAVGQSDAVAGLHLGMGGGPAGDFLLIGTAGQIGALQVGQRVEQRSLAGGEGHAQGLGGVRHLARGKAHR